jgi:predicted oxidoreductase
MASHLYVVAAEDPAAGGHIARLPSVTSATTIGFVATEAAKRLATATGAVYASLKCEGRGAGF